MGFGDEDCMSRHLGKDERGVDILARGIGKERTGEQRSRTELLQRKRGDERMWGRNGNDRGPNKAAAAMSPISI